MKEIILIAINIWSRYSNKTRSRRKKLLIQALASFEIFQCQRMRFMEVPQRLNALLHPPDPIVINHIIT